MGNSNKKPEDYEVVRTYKAQQWVNKQKKPNYQIWQNNEKQIRAEVYPLKKQLKPIDLDHYELRYNNSSDIVKVHNLSIKQDSTLCAKSSDSHVFVQRIPFRLSDVSDLTQPEALSVLKSAYSGFNTLSTFYGPVEPYEDLICFNESGKTKVWVNSNLAENGIIKDRQYNPISNFANLNAVYVNKLFDMVENKTQGGAFPAKLKNKFRSSNPKTYFQALNLIEEYAAQERIQIPPNISPRLNSFNSNLELQNASSQVNSYPPINFQNNSQQFQQSAHTFNQSAQIQNPATFQIRPSLPQNQYIRSHTSFHPSQPLPLRNNFGYQNQMPFKPLSQNQTVAPAMIIIPPVGATRVGFSTGMPMVNLSPRNNVISKPMSFTRQFDSPSKVVSMQVLNKQSVVELNFPTIENRNATPIGSVTNISEIKLSQQQGNSQSAIKQQNTEVLKPTSPVKARQRGFSLNTPQQSINVVQPHIIGGHHHRQFNPIFVQPTSFGNSQPIYYIQEPRSHMQHQLAPQQIQQRNFRVQQQQTYNLIRPAHQFVQIIPYPQAQIHTQAAHQTNTQSNIQQIQRVQSQQQSKNHSRKQSQRQSRPISQENRQIQKNGVSNVESVEQIHVNPLSNQEQRLMQAYEGEQGDNNDDGSQDFNENDIDNQYNEEQGQGQGEQEEERYEQEYERYQGLIQGGQGDEVERELERLQQQKIVDHSHQNQGDRQYFPFAAGTYKGQPEQIRRVATMQIRHQNENLVDFHQSEEGRRQQNREGETKQVGQQRFQEEVVIKSQQSPLKIEQSQESPVQRQSQAAQNQTQAKKEVSNVSNLNLNQNYTKGDIIDGGQNQEQYQQRYQYQASAVEQQQQKIPEDARYEDIEQYIRNKYKNYIGVQSDYSEFRPSSEVTPYSGVNRVGDVQMASYVQSKYNQISNQDVNFSFRPTYPAVQVTTTTQHRQAKPAMVSSYEYMRVEQMYGDPEEQKPKQVERKSSVMGERRNGNDDDILDVKNMQRSLDKKYSSIKSNQLMNADEDKKGEGEDNQFDVKKLQENLIRFEESRVGNVSNNQGSVVNQPRFETSQVSKIQSIDEILANRRRSSMNRGFEYKDQVITSKPYSYENQSPNEFGRKSRTSKLSKQLSDIDEKFNKYVKGGAAISSHSNSSKLILKPKQENEGYGKKQFDYENSSRMATGHFGYSETRNYETSSKNYGNGSEMGRIKGPSYEELRKFMWS